MRAAWFAAALLLGACARKGAAPGRGAQVVVAAAGDLQLGAGATAGQLAGVETLLAGDVRFANLEGPLTARGAESGLDGAGAPVAGGPPPRFAGPPAAAAWLAGRIDVVSLANNHALDQGSAGLADTVAALKLAGVTAATATEAAVLKGPGGRPMTLLARQLPPDGAADDARGLLDAVRDARRRGVVLVSLHWGHTGALLPAAEQRALARRLIDAGATAVLGHGPHVVQGVERRGAGVIAYSLGNLAFSCRCTDEEDAAVLRFGVDAAGGAHDVTLLPVAAGLAGRPARRSPDADLPRLLASLSRDLGSDAVAEAGAVRIR